MLEENLLKKEKTSWRALNKMGIKNTQKKEKLAKHGRRTKWAPVWVVLKRFGMGKKIHPSSIHTLVIGIVYSLFCD